MINLNMSNTDNIVEVEKEEEVAGEFIYHIYFYPCDRQGKKIGLALYSMHIHEFLLDELIIKMRNAKYKKIIDDGVLTKII